MFFMLYVFKMEVRFSRVELANVLLKPQQLRLDAAQKALQAGKVQTTPKADSTTIREIVAQAAQLGRHLDIQG